jgi:hypothetical protein
MLAAIFVKALTHYSQHAIGGQPVNYAPPLAGIEIPIVIGLGSLALGEIFSGQALARAGAGCSPRGTDKRSRVKRTLQHRRVHDDLNALWSFARPATTNEEDERKVRPGGLTPNRLDHARVIDSLQCVVGDDRAGGAAVMKGLKEKVANRIDDSIEVRAREKLPDHIGIPTGRSNYEEPFQGSSRAF